jgi:lipopolysaccharide export system protein LptA
MILAKNSCGKYFLLLGLLISLMAKGSNQTTSGSVGMAANGGMIRFSSAQAECNQVAVGGNICTYTGNAKFDEADNHLRAPKIVVYRDANNQIQKVVAIGKKAYYSAVIVDNGPGTSTRAVAAPSNKKNVGARKPVNAEANTITLYPQKNLMILEEDAVLTKEKEAIRGSYIEYDVAKQTLLSKPKIGEHTTLTLQQK